MRILATMALVALCSVGTPAFGQSLMKDFTWTEMRSELTTAGLTITSDGVSGDSRYVAVKAESGLVYGVYGFQCDTTEASQRCTGAEFVASFTLADEDLIDDALAAVDYAALADYRGDDGRLKVSRYIIFDGGISHANLQANLDVFTRLTDNIWDMLDDNDWLK
ncbi:MAG: hypothetical protein QM773_08485 [Hyphomonadaceae bacterium]